MKNPIIVHTNFLEELCFELNISAFNSTEAVTANFTPESLADKDNFESAFDIVEANRERLLDELIEMRSTDSTDPADYADVQSELDREDRVAIDLILLEDLGGVAYANPTNIASSITFLSKVLSYELGKRLKDEEYPEYYCKQIAECLKELCEIIL